MRASTQQSVVTLNMLKGNRRVKDVSGTPVSSHDREMMAINSIEFSRAWAEARILDSTLSPTHPKNLPEEVERAIILMARRILKLESEWS
jgi:hypothetical protein